MYGFRSSLKGWARRREVVAWGNRHSDGQRGGAAMAEQEFSEFVRRKTEEALHLYYTAESPGFRPLPGTACTGGPLPAIRANGTASTSSASGKLSSPP